MFHWPRHLDQTLMITFLKVRVRRAALGDFLTARTRPPSLEGLQVLFPRETGWNLSMRHSPEAPLILLSYDSF